MSVAVGHQNTLVPLLSVAEKDGTIDGQHGVAGIVETDAVALRRMLRRTGQSMEARRCGHRGD